MNVETKIFEMTHALSQNATLAVQADGPQNSFYWTYAGPV